MPGTASRFIPLKRAGAYPTTIGIRQLAQVLTEPNRGAQRFYQRLGASDQGGEISEPPGGGQIHGRRYAWKAVPDIPRP